MLSFRSLLLAGVLGVLAATVVAETPADPQRMDISLVPIEGGPGPYKVGSTVALTVLISCSNVPRGYSVYFVLHPLQGDAFVTRSGGRLSLSGFDVNAEAGPLENSDGGPFGIDPANYPRLLVIPPEALQSLAVQLVGAEKAGILTAAIGPEGLRLDLAFLAALGHGGDRHEKAFLSFRLPKTEETYDSVLMTPLLIRPEVKDGEYRILYRSNEMHSLRIAVVNEKVSKQ